MLGGLVRVLNYCLLFQPKHTTWMMKMSRFQMFSLNQKGVLGIQKKSFDETVLLSTENTCP